MRIYLTRVEQPKGCGYTYLVQKDCMSWRAFRTLRGVQKFLRDYRLTPKLVRRTGQWATFDISGEVENVYLWNIDEFLGIKADCERVEVDNGEYTLAKIVYSRGKATEYRLNPNVKERPKFTYEYFDEAWPVNGKRQISGTRAERSSINKL